MCTGETYHGFAQDPVAAADAAGAGDFALGKRVVDRLAVDAEQRREFVNACHEGIEVDSSNQPVTARFDTRQAAQAHPSPNRASGRAGELGG